MKYRFLSYLMFLSTLFFCCCAKEAMGEEPSKKLPETEGSRTTIMVDCDKSIRTGINKGTISTNLCWLLDSDKNRPNSHRSMKETIRAYGAGSLRFPYGHLADNYLWNNPSDNDGEALRPTIATGSTQPGKWDWAMNSDGTFKKAMDFDEYMELCNALDIRPLVTVNALSFVYKNGPALETLVKSAHDWAAYAKRKGYKVAYWQIGNEADHHQDIISMRKFIDAYKQIAKAIKDADPEAKTGPGVIGNVKYFKTINDEAPELIDFTSAHQYMFKFKDRSGSYEEWLGIKENFAPNVTRMQDAVRESGRDLEIVVTETGVTGSKLTKSNVYASLWWFDLAMQEIRHPNVSYIYFWGSHSPWRGEDEPVDDVGVLFSIEDNSRKPIALVGSMINGGLLNEAVTTTCSDEQISTYAFVDRSTGKTSVFISNKSAEQKKITIRISGQELSRKAKVKSLSGKNPYERKLAQAEYDLKAKNGTLSLDIPGYSISNIMTK